MGIMARHIRVVAGATLLMSASLTGALAQSVEAAAERLKAIALDQGVTIEWDSIEVSGDNGVLNGVKIGREGDLLPISNINLDGVSEVAEGYAIEAVTLDRYYRAEGNDSLTVDGVAMTSVLLPNEASIDSYGGSVFYETADIATVNIVSKGKEIFSLTDVHAEISPSDDAGKAMEFSGAAEGFTVDLTVIEDPQQAAVIKALGYEKLDGYLEMDGSWNPADGKLMLNEYSMSVVNAGSLGLSFDLGGYTPELIASIRQIQKQMTENPDGDSSQQGMAMLGLMQQMIFHSAEISFADDSLTNKIIEFVAQQQGMSASDIRNQAKAVLPFALAQLNNPEFTTMVTQAVSAYLDDPQSLSVRAEPGSPTPFAMIMASGMSNPVDLIKSLNVKVTAND